ncbi:MAG: toprim domain-containing protein [Sediminibacterium sp.]
MNCEQANRVDLMSYLATQGMRPAKENGIHCWYHSPLHEDNTPSFKVDRNKNTWYDFGLGMGGTLVDFVCTLHGCDITSALKKIESKQTVSLSFFPSKKKPAAAEDNTIRILRVNDHISDMVLRRYLNQRDIPKDIAEKFCKELLYQSGEKRFLAIGFKNNAGGYELRSPNFKGSSSPKFISYLDRGAKSIAVFEGFFDFLSYQSLHREQKQMPINFLVLNSLSFFTRSLLLMEKHEQIRLYLDNDTAGKKCVQQLLGRSKNVSDESTLYKGYKDLNEWAVCFGKQQNQQPGWRLRP